MAKNTIADLSVTPASNTDLLGQNSTGAADSNTIDTIIQNALGILARAYGDQGGLGTVGGSANAITLTSKSTYQQYQSGLQVALKAGSANTGAATLNLDGLGVKKIRRRGDTALVANDIIANGRYLLQYDSAYDTAAGAWVLMNPELGSNLAALAVNVPIFSCGQLQYTSTTVVTFKPFRGNLVSFPSGAIAAIGSSGITSTVTSATLNGTAAQPLVSGTLYYAYLWNNGSAYVIDWSATGHATDTATGIEIKSGDATRVLIGMARPVAGPLFSSTAASQLVATWFNRRPVRLANKFTTDRSTSSTSFVEVNTEIRCTFLTWGDALQAQFSGGAFTTAGSSNIIGGPSIDGATTDGSFVSTRCSATTTGNSVSTSGTLLPTEGYHYLTYMGAVSSGTGNWDTSASGAAILSGSILA